MSWDPEVESPATIAIIGAGATGIEAALYARFLGYNVLLFDKAKVAQRFLDNDDMLMPESFSESVSRLGLAALQAQTGKKPDIGPDEFLPYRRFAEAYLVPVARTDLLYDSIHVHSHVFDIARLRCGGESPDLQDRCNDEFRLVVESKSRGTWVTRADVVLDCSGLGTDMPRLGPCGGIAIGESLVADRIYRNYRTWKAKMNLERPRTLLVLGSQRQTLDAVPRILDATANGSQHKLIWAIPVTQEPTFSDVMCERQKALRESQQGYFLETLGVESIGQTEDNQLVVRLVQADDTTLNILCDEVLAMDPSVACWNHCQSLLVNAPAYVSAFPKAMNDFPLGSFSGWQFATGEPGYYVLGSKRSGTTESNAVQRRSHVRDVFALLGARSDLDLYRTIEIAN